MTPTTTPATGVSEPARFPEARQTLDEFETSFRGVAATGGDTRAFLAAWLILGLNLYASALCDRVLLRSVHPAGHG